MARRLTVERVLRDDDDASGQTIRKWQIQRDGNFITIRSRDDGPGFIMLRTSDVPLFKADLDTITELANTGETDG